MDWRQEGRPKEAGAQGGEGQRMGGFEICFEDPQEFGCRIERKI
jgi:hypothetical protein